MKMNDAELKSQLQKIEQLQLTYEKRAQQHLKQARNLQAKGDRRQAVKELQFAKQCREQSHRLLRVAANIEKLTASYQPSAQQKTLVSNKQKISSRTKTAALYTQTLSRNIPTPPKTPLDENAAKEYATAQLLKQMPTPPNTDPRTEMLLEAVKKRGWFLATKDLRPEEKVKLIAVVKNQLKIDQFKASFPTVPAEEPSLRRGPGKR